MTTEMVIFKEHNLRTAISDEGIPGVLQSDVCWVIGIKRSRNLSSRLDAKDAFSKGTPTAGGMQDMPYLTETGLYKALAGSRKPLAKELTTVLVTELAKLRKLNNAMASADVTALLIQLTKDVAELKAARAPLKPVMDYGAEVRMLINDWVKKNRQNPKIHHQSAHGRLNELFYYKHRSNINIRHNDPASQPCK